MAPACSLNENAVRLAGGGGSYSRSEGFDRLGVSMVVPRRVQAPMASQRMEHPPVVRLLSCGPRRLPSCGPLPRCVASGVRRCLHVCPPPAIGAGACRGLTTRAEFNPGSSSRRGVRSARVLIDMRSNGGGAVTVTVWR